LSQHATAEVTNALHAAYENWRWGRCCTGSYFSVKGDQHQGKQLNCVSWLILGVMLKKAQEIFHFIFFPSDHIELGVSVKTFLSFFIIITVYLS